MRDLQDHLLVTSPRLLPRRNVIGHACPSCKRLWAKRAARINATLWMISCRFCDWHRPLAIVPAAPESD